MTPLVRDLAQRGCDPLRSEMEHVVYTSDDNSLIDVDVLPKSEADAKAGSSS